MNVEIPTMNATPTTTKAMRKYVRRSAAVLLPSWRRLDPASPIGSRFGTGIVCSFLLLGQRLGAPEDTLNQGLCPVLPWSVRRQPPTTLDQNRTVSGPFLDLLC